MATLGNYVQFFANPTYRQAMVNSLEVTAIVTVVSVAARLPLRLDSGRAGAGALAAAGADAGGPAVLDLLCRALLFLAAGARARTASINQRADRLRAHRRAAAARQYAPRHGHRLRPFLRHAADADDLRQPQAAQPQLPQGGRRSRRRAGADLHPCHPAADPAGHHGRRLPDLRAVPSATTSRRRSSAATTSC